MIKIKFKTVSELVEFADELGIDYYNVTNKSIVLKGINGHSTVVSINTDKYVRTEPKFFANHLKQMGRDILKMELDRLLSITKHV